MGDESGGFLVEIHGVNWEVVLVSRPPVGDCDKPGMVTIDYRACRIEVYRGGDLCRVVHGVVGAVLMCVEEARR